jgi:YjjG family noncanonical pyrimidine nucleotidase
MPAKLKAVLFDLDDTLFDHLHSSRCGLEIVYAQQACFRSAPYKTFELQHHELLEKLHLEFLKGAMTLDEVRAERFRQLFALYGESPTIDHTWNTFQVYRKGYLESQRLVPGSLALLEYVQAQGLKIGIVTNNTVNEQTTKIRELDIEHLIDAMAISEEVGAAKPDPRIFEAALGRLDCKASEVVMIGDSWSTDVMGAAAVGIRCVWLNRHGLPCPDAALAIEVLALEPLEMVTQHF